MKHKSNTPHFTKDTTWLILKWLTQEQESGVQLVLNTCM